MSDLIPGTFYDLTAKDPFASDRILYERVRYEGRSRWWPSGDADPASQRDLFWIGSQIRSFHPDSFIAKLAN